MKGHTPSYPLSSRSLVHLSTSLPHLNRVIMPRGQKSKLRAREKRRQAREGSQDLVSIQTTAQLHSSSSPHFEDISLELTC